MTAAGAPQPAVPTQLTLKQWAVVITASMGALLEIIDTSITNVALTHIQATMGATLAEVGWVVTAYTIATVVMIPLSAGLSDRFGSRTYFLFCLIGFTAASMLCGLAPTLPTLVLARVLQGLLGGGLIPKAQAILFRTIPLALQGITQAAFGVVVLVGPALGPTLGGWLTDGLGWRWIFFINLPFGLLTVLLGLAFLAPDPPDPNSRRVQVDWFGIVLLAVGLGSLQAVLELGNQYLWFEDAHIRGLAVLSAISLPVFIWWELRCRQPAVALRVLRHRSLVGGSLFAMVLGMGLYGTVFLVPVFAQTVLGYTASQTGMLLLPGALASGVVMGLLGKVINRIDPRYLLAAGALGMAASMNWLAEIGTDTGGDSMYWPLMWRGITTVMMFLPLSLVTLGPLPREDMGAGSGFYNLTRLLGGSFGIALLAVIFDHRRSLHRSNLVEHLTVTNPLLQERLANLQALILERGEGTGRVADQALQLLSDQVGQQASLLAFSDVFRVLGLLFLLAMPLVLLTGGPARKAPGPGH